MKIWDMLLFKNSSFFIINEISVKYFKSECSLKPKITGTFELILNLFNIFSHSSSDIIITALNNFKHSLKDSGIIVATFVEGLTNYSGEGWVYPGCVSYRRSKIIDFAKKADLLILKLPWYHPRQTWYIMAKNKNRLPNKKMMRHLSGAVLFENDFMESWKTIYKYKSLVRLIQNTVSQTIFKPIRNVFHKT